MDYAVHHYCPHKLLENTTFHPLSEPNVSKPGRLDKPSAMADTPTIDRDTIVDYVAKEDTLTVHG